MSSFSSETLHPRARPAPFPSPFVSPLTWVAADQRQMGTATTYSTVRSAPCGGASCILSDCVHNLSEWAIWRPRASPPTKAITGDARGPGPLAGTGPCHVVDRICDQRARRLATTRPTPATPSRPTSAMATPVFAPVLASLLPSVLVPPAGWDCSTVGCGCSAVGWG